MILEGLVSTLADNGQPHWAAMGAIVDQSNSVFELRPFVETTTFHHLLRRGEAVFHTTDDVRLIVDLITGNTPTISWSPADKVAGCVQDDCCQYFELRVVYSDLTPPRASFQCRVEARGARRPFVGFNRAKHLILETGILATRLQFIPVEEWQQKIEWFAPIIRKTGTPADCQAFEQLIEFADKKIK